jgi:DNA repair protein RecN (Recombination protein N)
MLRKLKIRNFALIEAVDLSFDEGFTVITGETGSGKSILLGALNLILGERADYGVIRNSQVKTIVEATFDIAAFQLETLFEENDLDYSPETVIRREINAQGKSRAFVNDTPVQLQQLKLLSEQLIHIHSQHHTLSLKNQQFHLELLDNLGGNVELLNEYKSQFLSWKKKTNELNTKKSHFQQLIKDADYNRFQLEELSELNLEKEDFTLLEQQLNKLENIKEIQIAFDALQAEYNADFGLFQRLNELVSYFEKIKGLDSQASEMFDRLNSLNIEFKDIAQEASGVNLEADLDISAKLEIEEKLNTFNKALKKHSCMNQTELLEFYKSLQESETSTSELEFEITQLEKSCGKMFQTLTQLAEKLSEKRKVEALSVCETLCKLLADLKLENTQLYFDISPLQKLDENGTDTVVLYFSPNLGMSPKPVDKTASGGELSRLMLAIQVQLSKIKRLPTILFDEIDTGVSGDVAEKIGNALRKMAENMQVFAITHLPQVAAKGKNHWKVEKDANQEKTETKVVPLNHLEKIHEVARLMSGSSINEAAIEHAKALMS